MEPRYVSNVESKMSAWSGASGSPCGGGTRATTASRMASTPMPVLADAGSTSSRLPPIRSTTDCATTSGSALGRSTLLSTGTISRSAPTAR